jgi:signal transduction histidine kinase
MIQGNGDSASGGSDPQYQVAARILQIAADRLLVRMSLAETGSLEILREIASYAKQRAWTIPASVSQVKDPDMAALQWLLPQLASEDQSIVRDAVHRAIQLLSCEVSFHAAVERSARRQVYNLAYGLTHEINNPLANIVARAQKLMGEVGDPQVRRSLATIMDQGMRAHEMLAEVMRAIQGGVCSLSATDVASIVRQAWSQLQEQARKEGVRWECDIGSEQIYADVHAPSLLDALRMLGMNAIDVCGPNDAVCWRCDVVVVDSSNERVRIILSDTGPGLSREAQRSANDLFFSGREHGRGLGISLAVVNRIVEMHRGTFTMRSEQGAGCCIEIELPRVGPPNEARPKITL